MADRKLSVDPKKMPALLKKHGSLRAISRALEQPYTNVHLAYTKAVEAGLIAEEIKVVPTPDLGRTADGVQFSDKRTYKLPSSGRVRARQATKVGLPEPGTIRTMLFTSAQNDTRIHTKFWANLQALAEHYKAEIHVARYTYIKQGLGARGDKAEVTGRGANGMGETLVWDKALDGYLSDDRVEVAPSLLWCGEMNILPTAERPLSGLENYTGRASGIFPHPQIAMEAVASGRGEGTKFNYTTGTLTLRNYIQRKAGLKGEFHHAYGALLVEVDDEGRWYPRQINADSSGTFYDLDVRVKDGAVTTGHRVEAINWGDLHAEEADEACYAVNWGMNGLPGMIDDLRPRFQFAHDVNSFRARSHHRIKDPHERFRRHVTGTETIRDEMGTVSNLMVRMKRDFCETVVVDSNHHNHIATWLREDHRFDAPNVELWHGLNSVVLRTIREGKPTQYLKEALLLCGHVEAVESAVWLGQDESFVICNDANGGIECSNHGDLGINGSRGNPMQFTKMGRKFNIGHFHGPGIYKGVAVAGTSGTLTPEWTAGPSTWSHAHIVTYPNGKRAIVTVWEGKYRA